MNLQLLLCAASLSVLDLVNARPQERAPTPPGECVIEEAGRTYIGGCAAWGGADGKVFLDSPSCKSGEHCLVNQMPCSGQYNFFCVTENIGCFAAKNQNANPDYTGERLGQYQGICPQDLSCCHGCSGKECDPHILGSSNQPMIESQQLAGLPPTSSPESLSPTGFQLAFDLGDSTVPTAPNGAPPTPNADTTNFGQPSTGAADLLIVPNSQGLPQNIHTHTGERTGEFFKQAPAGINLNPNLHQKITLPVENPPMGNPPVGNPPVENQQFQPAPTDQENPWFELPL